MHFLPQGDMSEQIKHECGLAMVRLRKPIQYYIDKYGTPLYGIQKLQLLLQKQRNRGQDGAGLATIKFNPPPGQRYISRRRSNDPQYLQHLFQGVYKNFENVPPEKYYNGEWMKWNKPYIGELYLGHLRYGTHGVNTIETCHPFLRSNNWITRNLVLAGNFNLTNVDELFDQLVSLGQFPKEKSDTVTVLEKIGHFLDDEVQRMFDWYKKDGFDNIEVNEKIAENLDLLRVLKRACRKFDGGYVICGLLGHGDAFIMRDANGIRPAFYYSDDEIVVATSERPAIQTTLDIPIEEVKELSRGHALIMKKDGSINEEKYTKLRKRKACSFERIYFSRGTDRDIYLERKKLGENLAPAVMKAINGDLKNSVFSFVPNTAESAFYGLVKGVEKINQKEITKNILKAKDNLTPEKLEELLSRRPRVEKIVVKDAKLRTFIADTEMRDTLVSHVYDVTYGIVANNKDTLILLDDSIVRGTTLRDSIISIVARLKPKKIIVVSSAPQIRYPDCYGIDMSKLKDFVAFQALVALLEEHNLTHKLDETYEACKADLLLPKEKMINHVQALYDLFDYETVSRKITEIISPKGIEPEVQIIYQTIKGLHDACPNNNGDWYFSGNYPTPGGVKVVNRSFMFFMDKINARAYM